MASHPINYVCDLKPVSTLTISQRNLSVYHCHYSRPVSVPTVRELDHNILPVHIHMHKYKQNVGIHRTADGYITGDIVPQYLHYTIAGYMWFSLLVHMNTDSFIWLTVSGGSVYCM